MKMATHVRKIAREVLGVTKGKKKEAKDTWWWNKDVQKVIKDKKECYKTWFQDRSTSNMENYKEAKKNAKRAVSAARGKAYDELYEKLGTKEGEMGVYKLAKIRERKTRDLNQVKCIKDEADRVLVKAAPTPPPQTAHGGAARCPMLGHRLPAHPNRRRRSLSHA